MQFDFIFPAPGGDESLQMSQLTGLQANAEEDLLTSHPTERLGIATEDDPSLRWGARESAAAARPGWRGASCRAGGGRGEPVPGEMVQRVVVACLLFPNCLLCGCGGDAETGCAAGRRRLPRGSRLGIRLGDKDSHRGNLIYVFLT